MALVALNDLDLDGLLEFKVELTQRINDIEAEINRFKGLDTRKFILSCVNSRENIDLSLKKILVENYLEPVTKEYEDYFNKKQCLENEKKLLEKIIREIDINLVEDAR